MNTCIFQLSNETLWMGGGGEKERRGDPLGPGPPAHSPPPTPGGPGAPHSPPPTPHPPTTTPSIIILLKN